MTSNTSGDPTRDNTMVRSRRGVEPPAEWCIGIIVLSGALPLVIDHNTVSLQETDGKIQVRVCGDSKPVVFVGSAQCDAGNLGFAWCTSMHGKYFIDNRG